MRTDDTRSRRLDEKRDDVIAALKADCPELGAINPLLRVLAAERGSDAYFEKNAQDESIMDRMIAIRDHGTRQAREVVAELTDALHRRIQHENRAEQAINRHTYGRRYWRERETVGQPQASGMTR